MEKINYILCRLDEKEKLFEEYETLTNKIYESEFDNMEEINLKRFSIAEKIDAIDKDISAVCQSLDNGDLIFNALKNRCNRSELSEDLKAIFDKTQSVFSVIQRIKMIEEMLMNRLVTNKAEIEKKIKAVSIAPKVTQYLNAVGGDAKTGMMFGSKI